MIVTDVQCRTDAGQCELSAVLRFEAPGEEATRVFYRWPAEYGRPATIGDPFLAALSIPAMGAGERLAIEAPVSAALLAALAQRIAPVARRWGWDPERVAIEVQPVGDPAEARGIGPLPPAAYGRGAPDGPLVCYFSAGVDSWYSLRRRLDDVTHLLLVRGFELSVDDVAAWKAAHEHIAPIAAELGKPLVVVTSNVGHVAVSGAKRCMAAKGRPETYMHFRRCSGGLQVGVALCLAQSLQRFLVPTSWPWEFLEPAGTHPLIEPSWSTRAARFTLDGGEADRIDKVRWLAGHAPDALRRLRVCFEPGPGELNCGHCQKCLRTMLEMRLAGGGHLADTFARPFDLAAVRRTRLAPRRLYFWSKALEEAERIGDAEAARAVRIAFGRGFHPPRAWRDLRERAHRAWLSAPGRRFILRRLGRLPGS